MKRRGPSNSFLLTFVWPLIHLALCVVFLRSVIEHGWLVLIVVDFPLSLFLFAQAFQDDRFMLWFGVFGTLWSYGVSWAAWATWQLITERRRRANLHRSSGPQ